MGLTRGGKLTRSLSETTWTEGVRYREIHLDTGVQRYQGVQCITEVVESSLEAGAAQRQLLDWTARGAGGVVLRVHLSGVQGTLQMRCRIGGIRGTGVLKLQVVLVQVVHNVQVILVQVPVRDGGYKTRTCRTPVTIMSLCPSLAPT